MHRRLPKLDLNVTNRCNFRCAHCAFDSGMKDMPEMTVCQLRELLEDTRELGGEKIDITGGEATLRRDLFEILEVAKSLEYKVELVTNGSTLREDDIDRLCADGLDSIAVSLDGSTPAIHKRLRRVPASFYQRAINTICACVRRDLRTKVNTVVTSENMEDLPNIAARCEQLGVSELGIYYFTPVGRAFREGPDAVNPVKWLEFARDAFHSWQDSIDISLEFPLMEQGACPEGSGCLLDEDPFHLQILPDGNVYPCAILASYDMPIGNLHERSVISIWNDESLWRKYREKIHEVFNSCACSCVKFSTFSVQDYIRSGYQFVCPLRKFSVTDIGGKVHERAA